MTVLRWPPLAVFINGKGIAVVAVAVECARVCDDHDKVRTCVDALVLIFSFLCRAR